VKKELSEPTWKNDPQSLRRILAELRRLPLFEAFDKEYNGKCRSFYVRWMHDYVLHPPKYTKRHYTGDIRIDFAEKKTFDRWANSTNFTIKLDFNAPNMSDIVAAHLWMEKISRSKLFNFNSYFSTLEPPFFGHKNKYYKPNAGE
jgi:hypothetical protein